MSTSRVTSDAGLPAAAATRRHEGGVRARWRRLRAVLFADWRGVVGITIIVLFVVVALAAPAINALTGTDPYTFDPLALDENSAPRGALGGISGDHWLGVEPLTGRDLFAIIVSGARTSLAIAACAAALIVVTATVLGMVAGYVGGLVDATITAIINVLFGFPALLFMIAIGAVVPVDFPRPVLVVLVIGVFGWVGTARIVRNQTAALRNANYVQAARLRGDGALRIIFRELLPNLRSLLIVFTTLSIPALVGTEAALSFLGVGVPPPTPSWGRTIGDAISWVRTDPWYLIFPGAALFLITWGFTLAGDSLRDALDPARQSGRPTL